MGETLTQQRRVSDEDFRIVKLCQAGKNSFGQYPEELMVPLEEAPADSVPAAAVIRRVQALFGFTGRKERVGGLASQM